MPTRDYKRIWCKKCKDWTLHGQHYPNWEDWFCQKCETAHVKTPLSEIPPKKILEQRKRYKEWKKHDFERLFNGLISFGTDPFINMFSEPGSDVRIMESDAGQAELDKQERERKAEERRLHEEEKAKVREEILKYRKIGRNDLCLCGSGLKYKKCCLTRIQKDEQDYNL
jgi:hypothetical protein